MFNRDYTLFFDLNDTQPAQAKRVYLDFTNHLVELLTQLSVNSGHALLIADDLWNRMAQDGRHYHSPIHILAMFAHAHHAKLPVNNTLALAIWFHDAIIHSQHNPTTSNEDDTADWMIHTLTPEGIDPKIIHDAADAIRSTAHHLDNDIPLAHQPLMDLDLAGLASNPESFAQQSLGVRLESPQLSDQEYNHLKTSFFAKLLERESIYRTPHFAPFEKTARQQVLQEIKRLTPSTA